MPKSAVVLLAAAAAVAVGIRARDRTGSAGAWPNEPPGLTPITDDAFDALTGNGWRIVDNTRGLVTIVTDSAAPQSPPFVIQYLYPAGFVGGEGPGAEYYRLPNLHVAYVGLWWKPSNPWQGHVSSSNKIQYLRTDHHGNIVMVMYGPPSGPFELRVFPEFSTSNDQWLIPNVGDGHVTLGQWHRLEWLVAYNSGSAPGSVRWWLDGRLVGSYDNLMFPAEPLMEYKLSGLWGGAENIRKLETDSYWYDHVHISGR